MLYAVAELTQHNIRQIEWILTNKINANAFGADESYHLLVG
jgi:hypothetical protein